MKNRAFLEKFITLLPGGKTIGIEAPFRHKNTRGVVKYGDNRSLSLLAARELDPSLKQQMVNAHAV